MGQRRVIVSWFELRPKTDASLSSRATESGGGNAVPNPMEIRARILCSARIGPRSGEGNGEVS